MNIVPPSNFKSNISTADEGTIISNAVPSLPDTFRQQQGGSVPLNTQLNDRHPLENRVKNWEETQQKRQLEQYRQLFGVAEPMKRVMELKIVEQTDFNPLSNITSSATSSLHRDILLNKDCSVDWEDIFQGTGLQSGNMVGEDVHTRIEKQLGI